MEECPRGVIVRDCSLLVATSRPALSHQVRACVRPEANLPSQSHTLHTTPSHRLEHAPELAEAWARAACVCVCACIIFCVCAFRMGGPTRSTKRGLIIIRRRKHVYEWRQLFGRQHCRFPSVSVYRHCMGHFHSLGTTERARFFRRLFWLLVVYTFSRI